MTYCVAMRLDEGLVFLSDSRTNAGVDQIGTFRKMMVFERPGDRVMTLLSAGNLAITQAVREYLEDSVTAEGNSIWTAKTIYEAVQVVGDAVRAVRERDADAMNRSGIEFTISLIFGGQIRGERMRLFMIYSAGNFIEASAESPYFQIGESKYGKPVLDRMIRPASSLDDGAKCALVSMDSTLRSNISVGLPLDLMCYEVDSLKVTRFAVIDTKNQYWRMIHETWGKRLKQVFSDLPDPTWTEPQVIGALSTSNTAQISEPVRALLPAGLVSPEPDDSPRTIQSLADDNGFGQNQLF
jgi:putative proteasome-type protease